MTPLNDDAQPFLSRSRRLARVKEEARYTHSDCKWRFTPSENKNISSSIKLKKNDKFICFLSLKDDDDGGRRGEENDSQKHKRMKMLKMERVDWVRGKRRKEKTLLVFWKIDRKLLETKQKKGRKKRTRGFFFLLIYFASIEEKTQLERYKISIVFANDILE